jgi:hypothetical protein
MTVACIHGGREDEREQFQSFVMVVVLIVCCPPCLGLPLYHLPEIGNDTRRSTMSMDHISCRETAVKEDSN